MCLSTKLTHYADASVLYKMWSETQPNVPSAVGEDLNKTDGKPFEIITEEVEPEAAATKDKTIKKSPKPK